MSVKEATPAHPVHEYLTKRWSPYAFDSNRAVSEDDLRALFEAARWAASSYNEQPWRYLVATRDQPEEFQKLLGCLVEPNQQWAQHAPVLILTVASRNFERNNKSNAAAVHDIGLASANLTFEATHRGLYVHQMIGILPDKARETYGIPEGFDAITALAVGYPADPADAPDELAQRDQSERSRKPLEEIVFTGQWEKTAPLIGK